MRCHLTLPLALALVSLLVALCTGGALFYMLSLLVVLIVALGLIGVLWASASFRISAELSEGTVRRGEDVMLLLSVRHRGWIPIAPVLLELSSASSASREVRLRDLPGRQQTLRMPFHASHVGVFSSGIRSCVIEDLLGIFERKVPLHDALFELIVYPRTFDTEPLTLAPGDPGSEIMSRATEDLSAPSDVREYQAGDAMKKIHWKLSLRKGELMVRKYDEPILQDVLILMDCSKPPSWGHARAEADVRDALLETAASVYCDQARTDHSVRLPLLGRHPVDIDKGMGVPIALNYLSRVDFSETDRFERVLMMESARLRKVGCVVVIAARLTSAMVDIMIRMHRTGPNIRLYLITFAPEDANVVPLTARLRHAGIEVVFQMPEKSD